MVQCRRRTTPASLGMAVATFQVVAILGTTESLAWSSQSEALLSVFRVFSIDISLFASECALSNWYVKYTLAVVLPFVVFVFSLLSFCVLKVLRCGKMGQLPIMVVFDNLLFSVAPLFYVPMSQATLQLLDCVQLPNGKYVLDSDPSIACFDGDRMGALPLCVFSIVVFILGLPSYYAWCLSRARGR